MTDQYAVMGNPISHSKSPLIHRLFAEETSQALDYQALKVRSEEFKEKLKEFFQQGGKGLNITLPLKELAWLEVDIKSPLAERAGAVNTISLKDNKLVGHNTDGIGLVRDITQNHKGSFAGKKILVIGAGGAVKGVLEPILLEKPLAVTISNRTVEKANKLQSLFSDLGNIKACGFPDLGDETFDLIINGTSASLNGELPAIAGTVIGTETWCYDMMYGKDATPFNAWAEKREAKKTIDGLGMLVEQAAEAFYIWRGVRPQTKSVLQKLRNL